MCGILITAGPAGTFHHRMLESLRKRGPDEIGFWSNGHVNVGHARLAVIGLDRRSTEPLENESHVIAYNGEIYNFLEIKDRLGREGLQLPGANDAEVLLHAWTRWGPGILPDLDGFWAFAIYEKASNKLVLVRDQFGIKPLYYRISGDRVVASSLLRTVLEATPGPRSLDYVALSEYARYQFTFGEKTFIEGVRKVLPGHIVEISLDTMQVTSRCYEDILASPTGHVEFGPSWLEETRELVRQCVLDSTISDTSFTTFCSGGVDSSLITRLANPEIAYHCNFSDPDCNETFFAQQVVRDTPIRLFVVNAQESFDLVARLDDIVGDFDELSIGSVILPLDDVLAQVKRRYKVILTGTGGDELFAGYVRYMLTMGECNQDNYRGLFERTRRLPMASDRFELCHTKGDMSVYRFYDSVAQTNFRAEFERCQSDDNIVRAMLRFDARNFLGGLLNIDDKMCGRHSLESRPSLLHQRLVRWMQRLESPALLRNGELKPILRDIATSLLPDSVIHRKDKMGFTTPIGTFINRSAHQIRERITSSRFRDLYQLRRVNFTAETKYSREVFGLLLLDCWLNRYA